MDQVAWAGSRIWPQMSPTRGFYHHKAQGEFIMNLNVCNSQGIHTRGRVLHLWVGIRTHLLRKVVCLFVIFKSLKQQCPHRTLHTLGSPPWVRVHQDCLITFKTKIQELMNIEQFCHWKFHKIKTENFIKLWMHFSFFGKCLISKILWMVFYNF